jgi:hypothetical protein
VLQHGRSTEKNSGIHTCRSIIRNYVSVCPAPACATAAGYKYFSVQHRRRSGREAGNKIFRTDFVEAS